MTLTSLEVKRLQQWLRRRKETAILYHGPGYPGAVAFFQVQLYIKQIIADKKMNKDK